MIITNDELTELENSMPGLTAFITDWMREWQKDNPIGLQSECADEFHNVIREWFRKEKPGRLTLIKEKYKYTVDAILGGLFIKHWLSIS